MPRLGCQAPINSQLPGQLRKKQQMIGWSPVDAMPMERRHIVEGEQRVARQEALVRHLAGTANNQLVCAATDLLRSVRVKRTFRQSDFATWNSDMAAGQTFEQALRRLRCSACGKQAARVWLCAGQREAGFGARPDWCVAFGPAL